MFFFRKKIVRGARELAEWQRAMDQLRELERQFEQARQRSDAELMVSLLRQGHRLRVQTDLLLARAVAASTAARSQAARAAEQEARPAADAPPDVPARRN